jgi:PAS domain S-box-containing protein
MSGGEPSVATGSVDAPDNPAVAPSRLTSLLVEAVEEYAIFALDPRGLVSTWNKGAYRIKGYTADEIIGRHFSAFYIPEDIAAGKPQRELAVAAKEGVSRDEGWRVRKDGSRFWANVTMTAILGADGHLDGFAKVTRDDTDRRQMEEQVHRLELLSERERIAHAMHETVVRQIFDASMTLEGALGLIRHPGATERVTTAIASLDATLKHIRTIVLDLENVQLSRPS